jgi:hypothetical protein
MSVKPNILAVLRISILDSPINGAVYLFDYQGKKTSICHCRGATSPLFTAEDEAGAYHQSRDWFMNNFDGFVQVNKLEGQEEVEEKSKFESIFKMC